MQNQRGSLRFRQITEGRGSHLLVDLARDNQALDLRGALVDLEDLGVAVELLDRLLLGVTVVYASFHRLKPGPGPMDARDARHQNSL